MTTFFYLSALLFTCVQFFVISIAKENIRNWQYKVLIYNLYLGLQKKNKIKMERVESKETIIVEDEGTEVSMNVEDVDENEDVDILLHHGISLDDIKELKNAGINTIKGIEMITTKELLSIKGFDNDKIGKVQNICAKYNNLDDAFVTATRFYEHRKQLFKINTGSNNLK